MTYPPRVVRFNCFSRNISQIAIRVDRSMSDDFPADLNCRAECGSSPGFTKRGWAHSDLHQSLSKRWDEYWPAEGDDDDRDKFMIRACNALDPNRESRNHTFLGLNQRPIRLSKDRPLRG